MLFTVKKVIDELKTRCNSRGAKYTCSVAQTRTKFKRCVSICRKDFLEPKNASGIKRFQEDLELITWFKKLLSVVKTKESDQPEHFIELYTVCSSS